MLEANILKFRIANITTDNVSYKLKVILVILPLHELNHINIAVHKKVSKKFVS